MLEKNTHQIARNMQTARSFLYLRVISRLFANTLSSRFAVFGNYEKKNCKNCIDSIESKMHDLLRRAMFCCVYLLISDSDHNCINKSKHKDDLKLFYEWNWIEYAHTTVQRAAESVYLVQYELIDINIYRVHAYCMPPVKHKRLKCKTLDCAIPLVFLLHTAALLNGTQIESIRKRINKTSASVPLILHLYYKTDKKK